ncbi:MAG: AI-2E family transporter [Lachnospiraceae bacterium]|nr:AI-2E family transporter [Lachnospiraceae bacterium]
MEEQKTPKQKEKMNWNIKPYLAMGLIALLVIVLSISFFFLIYRYQGVSRNVGAMFSILQPVTIGLVLAYLISPIVNFEERHLLPLALDKMKSEKKARKTVRAVSIITALVFVGVIIGVLLQMVIPELYRSINGMIDTMPKQVSNFMDWITAYVNEDSEIAGYLEMALTKGTEFFENWAKTDFLPQTRNLIAGLTSGVIIAVRLLFHVIIGIILSIYILMSKEALIGQSKQIVYALFSGKRANRIIRTVHKSNEIFGGFISGKILDSAIIGILCFLCLYVMKMPYVVLVSVIVGVTNVIPFFGPYLGAVPSAILIMLANPIKGLYFIIFILVLQQVDGNIIGPKILGDSTGLSSFWVVFAILVGGGLFGVPGMIIGVPLLAVIFYIIRNALDHVMEKKGLPQDPTEFEKVESLDLEANKLVFLQEETAQPVEKHQKPQKNGKK